MSERNPGASASAGPSAPNIIDLVDIDPTELEVPFPISDVTDYKGGVVKRLVGNTLVIGYLSQDDDVDNPFETNDGIGRIVTCHRNASAQELEEFRAARGLNEDGQPDLKTFLPEALKQLVNETPLEEVQAYCRGFAPAEATRAMEQHASRQLFEKLLAKGQPLHEMALKKADDLRRRGDPDFVVLDCYQHSGVAWSISGEGMQDQFDTAKGVGVWIPDEELRETIVCDAIGGLLPAGTRVEYRNRGKKSRTIAYILPDGTAQKGFKSFGEAVSAAARALNVRLDAEALWQARRREAIKHARQACEEFNAWSEGDCYGYVAVTYENTAAPGDEPVWEMIDSDECWGCIGSDYAMSECIANVNRIVSRLEKEQIGSAPD